MKRVTYQVLAISMLGLSAGMIYGQNAAVLRQPDRIDVFQVHSQAEQDVLSVALLVAELDVNALSQLSEVLEKEPDPGTFDSEDRPVRLFGEVVDPDHEQDPIRKLQLQRLVLIHRAMEHESKKYSLEKGSGAHYRVQVYQRLNAELELAKNKEQKLAALKSAFHAFSMCERNARIRIAVENRTFDDPIEDDEPAKLPRLVKLFRDLGKMDEQRAVVRLERELGGAKSRAVRHSLVDARDPGGRNRAFRNVRFEGFNRTLEEFESILEQINDSNIDYEHMGSTFQFEHLQRAQEILAIRIKMAELASRPGRDEDSTVELFGQRINLQNETDLIRRLRLQRLKVIRKEINLVRDYEQYRTAYQKQLAAELELAESVEQRRHALNNALAAFRVAEEELAISKKAQNNEPVDENKTPPTSQTTPRHPIFAYGLINDVIGAHPRAQADVLEIRIQIEKLKRKSE